jgi:uncharacterized OB-fold protein
VSDRFQPPVSAFTEPYWEATRRRELLLQWCVGCATPIHYPRERCPGCLRDELEWRKAAGTGEIHAFTVDHRADRRVVALVELDEGARVMTNIVGCDPSEVRVGQAVHVTWEELPDGRNLPLYQPRETRETREKG